MKKILSLLLVVLLSFTLVGCEAVERIILEDGEDIKSPQESPIDEDGYYSSKEDVALYIHTYEKLPDNFIKKDQAKKLGWDPKEGNLWEVSPEKSIGGDRFGNREGRLPKDSNRQYYECDINYKGGYRGSERIVYSNDGLIYYTEDHYDSFTLLYGDE